MTKFSALLATGRISNLPTVWCNVLVAFLLVQLAPVIWAGFSIHTFSIPLLLVSCIAASCLYVGGCFLGDAVDVEFDKQHKPDRPIPMGVLSRSSIYRYAAFLLTLGLSLPFAYIKISFGVYNLFALVASLLLAAAIIIYSIWHKRSPWIGLPFIGACRFFLVLFGAYIATTTVPSLQTALATPVQSGSVCSISGCCGSEGVRPLLFIYAFAVGLYTICFASVARSESSPKPVTWRKGLMVTMLLLPIFPYLVLQSLCQSSGIHLAEQCADLVNIIRPSIAALIIYWLWMITAFRKINTNKGQFVSMSLAGFCLLDATFAAQFGWPWLLVCLILFALSLLLQKWAPAT